MATDELGSLRAKIDAIDKQLIELLNRRTQCVIDVGQLKTNASGMEHGSAFRPEREAEIFQRFRELNNGPLADEQIEHLFREIVSMSIAFQRPLHVAYLGPAGTFSHSAAIKQFGSSTNVDAQPSIQDVFQEVERGGANYGVVPVENSTEGAVNQTLDCLIDSDLRVCGEVNLPIHQALMTKEGQSFDSITRIYSHEQSLAQCRNWLRDHTPHVETRAVASNGEAARLANVEDNVAAIAGEFAAAQFNLDVLFQNIEDQASNATRFFILGKQKVPATGSDKTSVLVHAPNRSGALIDVLSPFKKYEINLTRVISRPSHAGNWSYVFFIDFDGHVDDENVAQVLDEVRDATFELKILGSYPCALESP